VSRTHLFGLRAQRARHSPNPSVAFAPGPDPRRPACQPPRIARLLACVLSAVTADTDRRVQDKAQILEQLLRRKQHLLRRQACRHAQLEADVEEALQSAYALFIERYNPPAEPLPWLMTTIKREAWRLARRSCRRRELAITAVPRNDGGSADLSDAFPDPAAGPGEGVEAHELHDLRFRALQRLKPDECTALLLLGLGYSYAEIATLRNWTHTKVNRCISEGRAALRDST